MGSAMRVLANIRMQPTLRVSLGGARLIRHR
jgi:hypothetical protein